MQTVVILFLFDEVISIVIEKVHARVKIVVGLQLKPV